MNPSVLLVLALGLGSPDQPAPVQPAGAPTPIPSTKVTEVRPGLHIGGLATYDILMNLKKNGIRTVVHLRPEKEFMSGPGTERAAVELQGLRYVHAPVTPGFEDEEVDAFRAALRTVDLKQGVYMHCFNGNRASGALLTWLVLDEKMPLAEALVVARKGGLTMVKIENAARFYISRNGGPAYEEQKAPVAGMP
jgi:uncharacterized protein (TIGR01244 family)